MVDVDQQTEQPAEAPPASWRTPAFAGAAIAVGTAAIVAVDPRTGGLPVCASQSMLGVDCPLCGGLRCVNSLARGDLAAALDHNVLLAVALPAAAVVWATWMVTSLAGRHLRLPSPPKWLSIGLIALVVAFGITRNLDLGAFTDFLSSSPSS